MPEICAAIAEAGGEPFELEIGGARMFNRSGILSADVLGETHKLGALAQRLEAALEKRGYPRESRPYKPHITLARDFRPDGDIGGIPPGQRRFTVDEVILFESRREEGLVTRRCIRTGSGGADCERIVNMFLCCPDRAGV